MSISNGAGSGYIGNSLVSAKKMVGYNVPTSSAEGTKTESVNTYSADATANTPKSGNGHARITWLRALSPYPDIINLTVEDRIKIIVSYTLLDPSDWSQVGIVYKKGSAPADKTDGTTVDITGGDGSETITGLDENSTYYFRIFSTEQSTSREFLSDAQSATTGEMPAPVYRCLSSVLVDGVSKALLQITDFSLIPQVEIEETTRIRSVALQTLSSSHPSFVTADGDSLYHMTQATFNATEKIVGESNYLKLSCPNGQYTYEGKTNNGLRMYNKIASEYITTWGTEYNTISSGYRDHYIGIILDDVYERGFIIIMTHTTGFDNPSYTGYQAYIYGGKIGDTDYIYETFKNA